jgi:hypothetical protein
MEEPNANEKEWAMGFCTGTTNVQNIFERAHKQIMRQVMDLNCLTWIFSLVLAKHLCFGQSHPPTPAHLSIVASFVRLTMAVNLCNHLTCIVTKSKNKCVPAIFLCAKLGMERKMPQHKGHPKKKLKLSQ